MKLKPPTAEEEFELIRRCQAGERDAGWELVLRHDGWCHKIAGRLSASRRLDFDDCLQIARLAMLRSIGTFRGDKGCRLLTHATYRMRQAIAYHYDNERACGAGPRGNRHREHAVQRPVAVPIDKSEVASLLRLLEQRTFPGQHDQVLMREGAERLHRLLANLEPREREIIGRRYGDTQEKLETIAADFGLSKERIRQIEYAALHKLSYYVRGKTPPTIGQKALMRRAGSDAPAWRRPATRLDLRRAS